MQIGDKIEDFLGLDETGGEVRLSNFSGKKLALYFYPKDLTPGCTQQACNLRDGYASLQSAGYEVVGVSTGDAKTHQKFIDKNKLPFHLIVDADHTLSEKFGVWGEKKLCGRAYMGIMRTTFIINQLGVVERILTPKEVKVKEHTAQIIG